MLKSGWLNFHMDIQVQYAIFKNCSYVADPGEVLEVVSKPHLVSDDSVVRKKRICIDFITLRGITIRFKMLMY